MMLIFTKLFAISIVARSVLGCSSKFTILLNEACFLVFKILMSFKVSEKKATSLPARKNEKIKRIRIVNIKIVVAAVVIAIKLKTGMKFPPTE